jgi:hypothetical protein
MDGLCQIGGIGRYCPKPGLGNCESDQASAKQDNAGNGQSEEAVRSKFFTHGTPPVVCPGAEPTTVPLHSQRLLSHESNFDPG